MTLNQLRAHKRVELVDDERREGNGVIVTLKQGWSFDPLQDNRVLGAETVQEAADLVSWASRFAGPYTD